jgi:hypothetical protein
MWGSMPWSGSRLFLVVQFLARWANLNLAAFSSGGLVGDEFLMFGERLDLANLCPASFGLQGLLDRRGKLMEGYFFLNLGE